MKASSVFGILGLFICTLSACVSTAPENEGTRETIWQKTVVDIMGRQPMSVQDFPALEKAFEKKTPAVVYLHGCGGRGNTAHSHIRFFKLLGFAVFAPSHYSRKNATTQCDTNRATTWGTKATQSKRIGEATIVRDSLRNLEWIDQDRIFLVGHSEGGWAVNHYPRSGDFAGIIAIAGPCQDGMQAHTPILTITARQDEFVKRNRLITCAVYKYSNATHLVVNGGDHNFILDSSYLAPPEKQARDAILAFMELSESQ